jgi:hypothetical protein
VVSPFEEVRLQTLTAGRIADTGDLAGAASHVREVLGRARPRAAAIGPSFWMILADGAEVLAKCRACEEAKALYREIDQLTKGQMPKTWRGNRLYYEAECALPADRVQASRLATEALAVYGGLLPQASKRRTRLLEIQSQTR